MTEHNIMTADQLSIEKPQPGIYADVPDSIYFKVKAVNNSSLTTLFNKTPAHLKWEMDNPEEDTGSTPSQLLGSLVHAMILQPDRVEDDVKAIPEGNKNSKAFKLELRKTFPEAGLDGKENWGEAQAKIEQAYPDKLLASKDQIKLAKQMVAKVKSDDAEFGKFKMFKIFKSGLAEVVFIWVDEATGLVCKCKFDWLNLDLGFGIDLKTTRDASPDKFRYSVSDYGYHRGMVFYESGAKANGIDLNGMAILAIETEQPFIHAWYEFQWLEGGKSTGEEYAIAKDEIRSALTAYAGAKSSGVWRGYVNSAGENVLPLTLKFDHYKRFRDNPFTESKVELPFDDQEEKEGSETEESKSEPNTEDHDN